MRRVSVPSVRRHLQGIVLLPESLAQLLTGPGSEERRVMNSTQIKWLNAKHLKVSQRRWHVQNFSCAHCSTIILPSSLSDAVMQRDNWWKLAIVLGKSWRRIIKEIRSSEGSAWEQYVLVHLECQHLKLSYIVLHLRNKRDRSWI